MRAIRHLVVHIDNVAASRELLVLAAALSRKLGARLTALLVVAPVGAGVYLSAEAAAIAGQAEARQRATLSGLAGDLTAAVGEQAGVAIDLEVADGDTVEALQIHARTTDLLIVSQRDPAVERGLPAGPLARLLVGAGCPVLVVPYIGSDPEGADPSGETFPRRALVAWSGTRESARALRDALPLLACAEHVELVTFSVRADGDTGAARAFLVPVGVHLGRHGISVVVNVLSKGEPSIGERMRRGWIPDVTVAAALLSHAADMQADFLVMGGLGHHRLLEFVLGGVTRSMLETMTVPVLMSH